MLPLIIAGAALSAYGAIKSAQDQAELDGERAADQRRQAIEIGQREQWNDVIRAQNTYKARLDFGAQAAGSGHSGSGIGSQLEIQRQGDLATALADREAAVQEAELNRGAGLYDRAASQSTQAWYINAVGGVLGTAGAYIKDPANHANQTNSGSPESLPRPSFSGG